MNSGDNSQGLDMEALSSVTISRHPLVLDKLTRLRSTDTEPGLFRTLVRNADIQNGLYDIHWLEKFLEAGGMAHNS